MKKQVKENKELTINVKWYEERANYSKCISDDHNKNISFVIEKTGVWRLSPAYDVMFTANTWESSSAHMLHKCVKLR